jgi:tetratricopeptide (TPR) repeat protein
MIRLEPANVEGYLARAFDYMKIGDYDKAIEDCNRAERLDKQNSKLLLLRGTIYRCKAEADLKQGAELGAKRKQ